MELQGKRVALLLEEQYNEFEVIYPYYRLKEAGAEVWAVGSGRASSFPGKSGLPFAADRSIDEVKAADFDGVVIPGGFAPDFMRRTPAMIDLVRQLDHDGKVIASICHGGWILASADIIRGKTVTSFFAIRDDLVHAGAEWVDQEVAVDGKLITARKPDDLPAFMRATIAALSGK